MTPNEMEALQMALLQELNDVEGVRGVATEKTPDGGLILVIHITSEDRADAITERLTEFEELPPWKLDWQ